MTHRIVNIAALLSLFCLFFWAPESLWIWGCVALIVTRMGLIALGVFNIQLNYFVRSISQGRQNGVALTFDDGPCPLRTPQILDILKKQGVQATFFLIGKKAEQHPELVRAIVEAGHLIGNHSFSHEKNMGFRSYGHVLEELQQANQTLENISGKKPLFFRPPFGVTNPQIARAIRKTGMHSIGWNVRSLDTLTKDPETLKHRIFDKLKPNSIILLHDTEAVTASCLEDVIQHCQKKGMKIVPLDQHLQLNAYDN